MATKGAIAGLVVGLLVLGIAFLVAFRCLPYRITSPPPPWPWVCTDPAFTVLGYLAFPVNLLTHDLSRAAVFSPLSLASSVMLGALVGLGLGRRRPRSPD